MSDSAPRKRSSPRMSGRERREQLVAIGTALFSRKGYESTSVEEIAARAGVSKPIVYEHFGGKEGLYAVIVDRETATLLQALEESLSEREAHPRTLLERAAIAFFTYIEQHDDGFRVLVRDSPVMQDTGGSLSALLGDVAARVEQLLAAQMADRGYPKRAAGMYAQMLVGLVAYTGQWWLETGRPSTREVAAHVVNLAWSGLSGLERSPRIIGR